MKEYRISTLHCANCAKTLEARLRTLDHGELIRINHHDSTIFIDEQVNLSAVKRILESEKAVITDQLPLSQAHDHGHHFHAGGRNIAIVFFLNLVYSLSEVIFGFLFNSTAILTDAVHDFGDALSIGLAWIFEKIAGKEANERFTFGHRRFSLLGALITSIVLIIGSIFSMIRAVPRILSPVPVHYEGMMWLAIAAIAVNLFATWLLSRGSSHNEKLLSLHVLEDALGWIAVLIVSIILRFKPWYILDPILSIAIALFILYHALPSFKTSVQVFMEAVPEGVDLLELRNQILSIDGVHALSHFHFWSIDGHENAVALTVYTDLETTVEYDEIREQIRLLLLPYEVTHSTIEIIADKDHLLFN